MLKSRYHFEYLICLLVALSAGARVWQIDGFSGDYDEGAHLMEAWLLSQGYHLYEEILMPLPPLLVQPLAWLFWFTGPSAVVARLWEIGWAMVGLVALAYLGRRLWSPTSGLIALSLLSLAPNYFRLSRISLGNVPAVALGIVALYSGLVYFDRGQWRWLIIAGLTASLSLLIKPLMVVGPLILIGLVAMRRAKSEMGPAYLILGLALTGPLLIALLSYDRTAMIDQVITFRYQLGQTQERDITFNLTRVQDYLTDHLTLTGLAVVGLGWYLFAPQPLPTKRDNIPPVGRWFLLSWLGLTGVLLLQFESLQRHHLILLEPFIALLGAITLEQATHIKRFSKSMSQLPATVVTLVGLLLGLSYLIVLPGYLDDHLTAKPRGTDFGDTRHYWQAVEQLQQLTTADQLVVSDELAIPFEAGRQVPPWLADPSRAVIQAGYLTDELAIDLTTRHQVVAVIFWSGRFEKQLPGFRDWVTTNFRQSVRLDEDKWLYFDR